MCQFVVIVSPPMYYYAEENLKDVKNVKCGLFAIPETLWVKLRYSKLK